jgi:hypothetical protein
MCNRYALATPQTRASDATGGVSTAPGLPAFHAQVKGTDSNAVAFNAAAKPRDSRARDWHIGGTQNFRDGLVRRAPASKLGNPRLEREKFLPLPWHNRGIVPHGLDKSVVRLIGRGRFIYWYM